MYNELGIFPQLSIIYMAIYTGTQINAEFLV